MLLKSNSSGSSSKVKCSCPHIGGPDTPTFGTGMGVVCCDRLRCTKCDLTVISFDNYNWKGDVDYMFFRNCYPSEDKLMTKLDKEPGCRAYTCQCTWTGVCKPERLDFNSPLRWVCGGH
mmetsp:Transcript_29813/g.57285  ORF Transcript_29813/g.57285 Transcript_29813/m.57285 type:complete len:119 (+) Transcript_29813:1528-1884(+)